MQGACVITAVQLCPKVLVLEIMIIAANKRERFVGGFTVMYLQLAVDTMCTDPQRDFSNH